MNVLRFYFVRGYIFVVVVNVFVTELNKTLKRVHAWTYGTAKRADFNQLYDALTSKLNQFFIAN